MANKKITELGIQTYIPANTQNLIFPVVSLDGGVPTTRQLSYQLVDNSIRNFVEFAFSKANTATVAANTADIKATSGYLTANAAFALANSVNAYSISSYAHSNAAFQSSNTNLTITNSAIANLSSNISSAAQYANTALNLANAANTTSLVYISEEPTTNKGQAGDKKGMVYLNGTNYFLYCSDNYNGTTNIWHKIVSTDNW
jgi:hypothetical protein